MCTGQGKETTGITANMKFEQMFQNCYKTVINRVFDWSDTWTGENAKILEKCVTTPSVATKIKTWTW